MTEPVFSPDTDAYAAAGNAQAIAADPVQSAWVAANAGSGKTKVLIDRVARLLLRDAPPDSILCITYTRAAANEMISRLFKRLGDWSVMEGAELARRLGALEGRDPGSYDDAAIKKARALFAKALETPGGLRIETIHAFSARLLRRFPLEAGIVPGFREIEEADAEAMWQSAARNAVLDLAERHPDILDAIALEGGGLGIDAALGLAKSAGDALLRHGDDPSVALRDALGAPDASVADLLRAAVDTRLPADDYRGAIEVLQAGSKKEQGLAATLEDALNADDLAERFARLRGLWRDSKGGHRKSNIFTKKAPPEIADLFSITVPEGREITRLKQAENDVLAAEAVERTEGLLRLARPLLEAYAQEKAARGALDFDDLIAAAQALLTRSGLAAWVLYKLDGGLTHVLLDEAQDTAPEQWDILHALTEEFFAGLGAERETDPRTLFVVGDEKQSIYSFQGADPRLFLTGKRAFITRTRGEGHTPDMLMSFRSCPEVLSAVDGVMAQSAIDVPATRSQPPATADLTTHTARRANQAGRVELWPIEEKADAPEDDPWDAPVDAQGESSPKARLAAQLAGHVRQMVDRGETVWVEGPDGGWRRKPMTAGDVLILVRKRKGGLFDALIQNLKREGLPVAGADRLVLSDHIGVQDCLNLIRFVLMPSDDLTLAEILRGPFCDLVDDNDHLFPLAHGRGKSTSLWSRLQASKAPEHTAPRAFLEALLERSSWPPFEFLTAVLECPVRGKETGWDRIGARLGSPARDPIEALCARALAHDGERGASLQTFLSAMETDQSEIKRDLAEAGGAVRVMTVHGAKGLQAPVVILPDTTSAPGPQRSALLTLEDGLPVWAPSKAGDTDHLAAAREDARARMLEEHVRLLYVALTRAQDRLIVCGAWYGRSAPGFADLSWYDLCAKGFARAGAMEDDATGILALGAAPPVSAPAKGTSTALGRGPTWLRETPQAEARGARAISPSHLTADAAPVTDPLGPRPPDRRLRGRLIHSLLERLPQLGEDERADAAARFLAKESALRDDERREIAETSLATLADPAMSDVFSPEGRAEAAIVGAGTGWPDGTVINGRVDRLVITDTQILVADIKTDRPPPKTAEGVGDAYLVQMAAYQNVLEAGFPGRSVECVLVWTDGPRLMPLPRPLLLEALNRARSGL
ncbi:MAG: double-strand break repair helicase AddA [Pseudomonadota bacterium]